jgi:arabinose-5-phosphate isomerase
VVSPETPVLDVLRAITQAGAGGACVVSTDNKLLGFITDGDLRRHFLSSSTPFEASASRIMATGVSTISPELLAIEALEVFQNFPVKIGDMPVVAETGEVVGLIMIKDLLRAGIVS